MYQFFLVVLLVLKNAETADSQDDQTKGKYQELSLDIAWKLIEIGDNFTAFKQLIDEVGGNISPTAEIGKREPLMGVELCKNETVLGSEPCASEYPPKSPATDGPIPKSAICMPELRAVNIKDNIKDYDSSFEYYPMCVKVNRCGGVCLSHKLSCQPTKTEKKTIELLVMKSIGIPGSTLDFPVHRSQKYVEIEVHTECKCGCIKKKENCLHRLHDYNSKTCECVCRNEYDQTQCIKRGWEKNWDNDNCLCSCARPQPCTHGKVYHPYWCRCQ